MKKIRAFTLAETLITLVVIGVVAALTIPTLMNMYQERQFKTAWKVAFSELSQAQKLLNNDYDGNLYGECESFDDTCLRDLFVTKISTIKKCDAYDVDDCKKDTTFLDGSNIDSALGIDANDTHWPMAVTNKGMSIKFRFHNKNCEKVANENEAECGWMQIDVNGQKAPNIVGKDVFFLSMHKDKLSPFPGPNRTISREELENDCKNGSGAWCSQLYLE